MGVNLCYGLLWSLHFLPGKEISFEKRPKATLAGRPETNVHIRFLAIFMAYVKLRLYLTENVIDKKSDDQSTPLKGRYSDFSPSQQVTAKPGRRSSF